MAWLLAYSNNYFALVFAAMLVFAFFAPVVCTGLIFVFCRGAFITAKKAALQ
jgi:hypothetical protein